MIFGLGEGFVGKVASLENAEGKRSRVSDESPSLFGKKDLVEGFKVAKPETTVDFTLTNEFICT